MLPKYQSLDVGERGNSRLAGRDDLDGVVFGHRVGEQLLAHRLGLLADAGRIRLGELDLDHLALAHLADSAESQGGAGIADCLALRIENARLQCHPHTHFHVSESRSGRPPERSAVVTNLPSHRATAWVAAAIR